MTKRNLVTRDGRRAFSPSHPDVLIPQRGVFADEFFHHFVAFGEVEIDDFDAVGFYEFAGAGEGAAFAADDLFDAELDGGAGAEVAWPRREKVAPLATRLSRRLRGARALVEGPAVALGEPRSTAGYWLMSLRDDGSSLLKNLHKTKFCEIAVRMDGNQFLGAFFVVGTLKGSEAARLRWKLGQSRLYTRGIGCGSAALGSFASIRVHSRFPS